MFIVYPGVFCQCIVLTCACVWIWLAQNQIYVTPIGWSSFVPPFKEQWKCPWVLTSWKNSNILQANLVKGHKKRPNVCVAQFYFPSFLVWPSGKYFEQHWPLQPPIHHPSSSTAPHRIHVCESSLWWSSLPRPPAAVLYIQMEIRGAAVMYTLLLLLLSDSLRRQSRWGFYKKKNLEKNSSHELIKTSAKTSKALLIRRLKVWSEVFVIWWAGEERITEHFDPANEIKSDNK